MIPILQVAIVMMDATTNLIARLRVFPRQNYLSD
jgi:hypothetical protein